VRSSDHRGFPRLSSVTGRTLVIGSKVYQTNSDRRLLYKNAIGLDMEDGEGVDIVHNLESPLPGQYDHIDCCSVLEHSQRPWLVAENIRKLMAPRATILLAVPFAWRVHGYPSDYWRFTIESFPVLFPTVQWEDRHYLINGKVKHKHKTYREEEEVWIARSEAVGWGHAV